MNLQELIADRRTIHDYRTDPLPTGALERALTAALSAPNHRMTEPWRFVQVGPQTRAVLAGIAAEIKGAKAKAPLDAAAVEKIRAKILEPAELLVVCQVKNDDPATAREDYAAVACAIENAMLAFWAEGIGSKWSTGGVTTDPRSYVALGIDPGREEVVAFVWAGYALRADAVKPRRRRLLGDVLRSLP
jgi:nitroreductase